MNLRVNMLGVNQHPGCASIYPSAAMYRVGALASLRDQVMNIKIEGCYDKALKPTAGDKSMMATIDPEVEKRRDLVGFQQLVRNPKSQDVVEQLLFLPTCNIAGITTGYQGPGSKTVLPAQATAKLDFRLIPNQDPDDVLALLRKHLDRNGFEKLDISNVVVKAGTTITEDAVMKLGQLSETVNVSSAPPVVETTASNFSTSISTQIIDKVPIVGRDIQTLVQLMPGITQSVGPTGSSFGFDSQFGGFPDPTHIVGSGISANGSQGGANAWYLDGTLNATLGPESVVVNPSPDAVSEFNLVNNGLSAQWSRTSGAVVNEPAMVSRFCSLI